MKDKTKFLKYELETNEQIIVELENENLAITEKICKLEGVSSLKELNENRSIVG